MPSTLPDASNCCIDPCESPLTVTVPGPAGADGANGVGIDGDNAFTVLTAGFTMPAVGATVVITVAQSDWMVPAGGGVGGQVIYIEFAGYFEVISKAGLSVTIKNLGYTGNLAPTTAVPNGARVSPGGLIGPAGSLTGAAGGDLTGNYPNPQIAAGAITDPDVNAANKDGLAATPSMRTLGAGAQQAAGGTDARLSDSRAPSGAAGGDLVGTYPNPTLATSGVAAGTYGSGTGIPIIQFDAKGRAIAAAETHVGFLPNSGLIATQIVNMNITTDQSIAIPVSRYIIRRVVFSDVSVDLTGSAAQGGLYNAPAKPAGGRLTSDTQLYTALDVPTKFIDATLVPVATTTIQTAASVKFSLTTAHGVAATARISIFGDSID